MPALLSDRKLTHPVLLDPKRTYRGVLKLAVYPTATLLDAEGQVAWQGLPYWRKTFADECEKQIALLLAEDGNGAGPEKPGR